MENKKKMESKKQKAEKYLTIQLLGKNGIRVNAYRNKEKTEDTQPDFKGNGVAVWINEWSEETKTKEIQL